MCGLFNYLLSTVSRKNVCLSWHRVLWGVLCAYTLTSLLSNHRIRRELVYVPVSGFVVSTTQDCRNIGSYLASWLECGQGSSIVIQMSSHSHRAVAVGRAAKSGLAWLGHPNQLQVTLQCVEAIWWGYRHSQQRKMSYGQEPTLTSSVMVFKTQSPLFTSQDSREALQYLGGFQNYSG